MIRIRHIAMTLGALLCVIALASAAQEFPVKAVRIIVPYPPGGGVDTMARPLAERLAQKWSQSVLVENKPGASTIIGAELVARATPDGYTLMMTTDSTITSNPHLYAKLPYDPVRDLAPVTQLIRVPQMVVAHPSFPARTLAELVGLAKQTPGKIAYASYGSGSQPHLLFEALRAKTGAELDHVPYKGVAPAIQATVAGEVMLTLGGASVTRGLINDGRLRPLAIARAERLAIMPSVPTLREAGFADIDPLSWFGLFATGGTPAAVLARIQRDVAEVFADPAFRERHMLQRGFDPVLSAPSEFAEYIQRDLAVKARLVKNSGAKPD